MAEALILDAEALNALAQPRDRKVLASRAASYQVGVTGEVTLDGAF